jgi:hypothetical protein
MCHQGHYCSQRCEDRRGLDHLFLCAQRPITTADYLWDCITKHKLPDADDVLEDFGFNHFVSFADRCKLLGLYQGLSYSEDITPERIHQWRLEGSLVVHIKEHFYNISEKSRGGYFPWFLTHSHLFKKSANPGSPPKIQIENVYDLAREYLDEADKFKQPSDLKPVAKQNCFSLLAMAILSAHPHPIQSHWYDFGFCTCQDEPEERALGGFYVRLLLGDKCFEDVGLRLPINLQPQIVNFTEFWQAYEAGTLIQLMISHGFDDRNSHLRNFLGVPPESPRPSVWSLKQFVAVDNPAEFPPCRTLEADYGFMNCQSFAETCLLLEIYKKLLVSADPLKLHEACLNGELFEFAQKFQKMEESYRRLMKNFYPLEEQEFPLKTKEFTHETQANHRQIQIPDIIGLVNWLTARFIAIIQIRLTL